MSTDYLLYISRVDDRGRGAPRDSATRIDQALRDAPDGLTMRELVSTTGLHENAIRRTLASLSTNGSVHVEAQRRRSSGRPTLRYRRAGGVDEPFRQFLPLLLDLLDPEVATDAAAYAIGRDHGRASPVRPPGTAREAVMNSMISLGFDPREEAPKRPGATVFALTRCPFLDAVTSSRRGRRICALHHGFLAGIADANAGTLDSFEINDPRAAPCRLSVSAAQRIDTQS